jgi:hypothetical protein
MTYAFANKEDKVVYKSYEDPYDALVNRKRNDQELCIIKNGRVVAVLPTRVLMTKWGVLCAQRFLPIFENSFPHDNRPRLAILATKKWIYAVENDTSKKDVKHLRNGSRNAFAAYIEAGDTRASRAAYIAYVVAGMAIDKMDPTGVSSAIYIKCAATELGNENEVVEWLRQTLWLLVVDPWYEFTKGYFDPKNPISRLPPDVLPQLKEYLWKP